MYPSVRLKSGRERSVQLRHPWIFSGALAEEPGIRETIPAVRVLDSQNRTLGIGYYHPDSQIRVRMLTWDSVWDPERMLLERLMQAYLYRKDLGLTGKKKAYRWVYAESDGLPGLIIDVYADTAVIQWTTAGMLTYRTLILAAIKKTGYVKACIERVDAFVIEQEKIPPQLVNQIHTTVEQPVVQIEENGYQMYVDIHKGHKTGCYLDQRDARAYVQQHARGRRILNLCAYTGGFAWAALQGGALEVHNVDTSASVLEQLEANRSLNGWSETICTYEQGDVFDCLRRYAREQKTWDMIILDPPKFIHGQGTMKKACRGYQDLNRWSWHVLNSQGALLTFSCSGLMTRDLFQKIVFSAAVEAGSQGFIEHHFQQALDHPVHLNIPESLYLKGLCVRKL